MDDSDSESESSLILSVSDTSYECELFSGGSDVDRENKDCLRYQFEPYASESEVSNSERDQHVQTSGTADVCGESASWQHRMRCQRLRFGRSSYYFLEVLLRRYVEGKCIDILIEKEYLERVDGEKDTYSYLA